MHEKDKVTTEQFTPLLLLDMLRVHLTLHTPTIPKAASWVEVIALWANEGA